MKNQRFMLHHKAHPKEKLVLAPTYVPTPGRYVDLQPGPAREALEKAQRLADPYIAVSVDLQVSLDEGRSTDAFSLAWATLESATQIINFRRRLRGEVIWEHEDAKILAKVHATGVEAFERHINRDKEPQAAREEFLKPCAEKERRDEGEAQLIDDSPIRVHIIPDLAFKMLKAHQGEDSAPQIYFGKQSKTTEALQTIPATIQVHGALVSFDDISRFVRSLEQEIPKAP